MFAYLRKCHRLSALLAATLFWLTLSPAAHAGIIGNDQLLLEQQGQYDREQLLATFQRDDVRQLLIEHGVNPDSAADRVAAMSDAEVAELNSKIDQLPSGSGVVGAAVFIFLVLLVTDILGYTDIFPFVKKAK